MILIGESKKKIFTIPEGYYIGLWSGHICDLYQRDPYAFGRLNNYLIYHFQTTRKQKIKNIPIEVKVIIEGTKAKIYQL